MCTRQCWDGLRVIGHCRSGLAMSVGAGCWPAITGDFNGARRDRGTTKDVGARIRGQQGQWIFGVGLSALSIFLYVYWGSIDASRAAPLFTQISAIIHADSCDLHRHARTPAPLFTQGRPARQHFRPLRANNLWVIFWSRIGPAPTCTQNGTVLHAAGLISDQIGTVIHACADIRQVIGH